MPVIKSAKKKLRQDIKKTLENKKLRKLFAAAVKKAKKNPTDNNIKEAVKTVDKIAQKKIIHKNKAARIKSALSKLIKAKLSKKDKKIIKKKSKI